MTVIKASITVPQRFGQCFDLERQSCKGEIINTFLGVAWIP